MARPRQTFSGQQNAGSSIGNALTTEDEDPPRAADSSMPPTEPMTVDELIAREGDIPAPQEQSEEERQLSITDILRQRKAAQRRKGGIEFTNLNTSNTTTPQPSDALIEKDDDIPADIKSVIERFAPQTGQITETTDKHMYVPPVLF